MEDIHQMRKRQKKEIKVLQEGCFHEKLSPWMDYAWAPGHFAGRVKVCNKCGRIIEQDNKPGPMLQQSIDNPPKPISQEELDKLNKLNA